VVESVKEIAAEIDTLKQTVKTITPLATGITKDELASTMYVSLTTPLTFSGKQIANGKWDAMEIDIVGLSDANTVTFTNGNNLQIKTTRVLGKGDIITLKWIQPLSVWIEKSFTNN